MAQQARDDRHHDQRHDHERDGRGQPELAVGDEVVGHGDSPTLARPTAHPVLHRRPSTLDV